MERKVLKILLRFLISAPFVIALTISSLVLVIFDGDSGMSLTLKSTSVTSAIFGIEGIIFTLPRVFGVLISGKVTRVRGISMIMPCFYLRILWPFMISIIPSVFFIFKETKQPSMYGLILIPAFAYSIFFSIMIIGSRGLGRSVLKVDNYQISIEGPILYSAKFQDVTVTDPSPLSPFPYFRVYGNWKIEYRIFGRLFYENKKFKDVKISPILCGRNSVFDIRGDIKNIAGV